jgi:glycerate 2-kinase
MHFKKVITDGFSAALKAGIPNQITKSAYLELDQAPSHVIALGKAAGAMADAVRDCGYHGPGLVITTDENHRHIDGFNCIASAHPVPDKRGLGAANAVETLASGLSETDHLLLLISGGGSALLPAPASGISLAQKIALNEALLASGLDIHAMNIVRRLFSRLKGGQLARLAAPARITQFLLSDVPGDKLESIASGLAVADPVPFNKALVLIRTQKLDQLDFVTPHLDAIIANDVAGPVRPGDSVLDRVTTRILASNSQCREAAASHVQSVMPQLKWLEAPNLRGEAAEMARRLAALVMDHHKQNENPAQPFGFVAGGETTVTLDMSNCGKGGRSQELALAFALAMRNANLAAPKRWAILAGGTDGRDGPTDAAGGVITSEQGFDQAAASVALAGHASYDYLRSHDQLLMIGATGTNLADLVLVIAQSS